LASITKTADADQRQVTRHGIHNPKDITQPDKNDAGSGEGLPVGKDFVNLSTTNWVTIGANTPLFNAIVQ